MAKNKRDEDDFLSFLEGISKESKGGNLDLSFLENLLGEISDDELFDLNEDDLEGLEFDEDDVDDFDDLDDIDDEDLEDIDDD